MKQLKTFNQRFKFSSLFVIFFLLLFLPKIVFASFSFVKSPTLNPTKTSVSFSVKSTEEKTVSAYIAVNGNNASIQKRSLVFKPNETKEVTFNTLVLNATYEVTIKETKNGRTETIANLGTFSTSTVQTSTPSTPGTQANQVPEPAGSFNECNDNIDNDGDGKADHYGIDSNKDGVIDVEPDPACFALSAKLETADDVAQGSIIPCTNKCSTSDVFKLLNSIIRFAIKVLLVPLFVFLIMYMGYRYIMARGKPVNMARLKKAFGNIVIGILLIVCAWLLVSTFLRAVGYTDRLYFFEEIR
jgi:hypothetical protein